MTFVRDCPFCHNAVTLAEAFVGRPVACPHCSGHFIVPSASEEDLPDPPVAHGAAPTSAAGRFTFTCQRCGSVLESSSNLCGQSGSCPTCGAVFTVPGVDPQTGRAAGLAVVPEDGQLPTPMHAYATAGQKAPQITRLESGEQVIVCPRCAAQMQIDAEACSACGIPFTMEGAASIGRIAAESNGLATAALTTGILAMLSFCLPILGFVAIGLGIGGMRRAQNLGRVNGGRRRALAGIICGLMSLALFALLLLSRGL